MATSAIICQALKHSLKYLGNAVISCRWKKGWECYFLIKIMAIPLGKWRPGTSPWLANMQTQWEQDTQKKTPCYVLKTSGKKKNQKMWGMKLSLPLPQHALLRKALGLQMRVSNDSQTGLLHRHSRHSFHSSLTWPSWGEGTCFRQGCKWEEEQGHTLVSRMNYHGEQSLQEGAWPTSLLVALAPRFTLHSHCSPPQHMFCLPFTSSQRTP